MLGVKHYMNLLKTTLGYVPVILLKSIVQEVQLVVKHEVEEDNEENRLIEISETADLLEHIENVEDILLDRTKRIIFYLVFLCIIFVYNMSHYKIQESFYINQAVNEQIYKKLFFRMNKEGLENSFGTIKNSDDLSQWLFNVYLDTFNYQDGKLIIINI